MRWAGLPRLALAGALTLKMSLGCIVLSFLMTPEKAWLLCGRRCARGVLWVLGLDARLVGARLPEGPALFIANHQSLLDPFILMALLPASTKWVAKAEIRRIPFVGRAVRAGGVYIDRGDHDRAVNALKHGLESLPENWSVAVFPEGTRSPDGTLRHFRHGAAAMATYSHLPVVPVGIAAAPGVLTHEVWSTRPGRVDVAVGEAIDTAAWVKLQVPERTEQLHDAVASLLARGAAG